MVGSRYEYLESTHTAVLPPVITFKLFHDLPSSHLHSVFAFRAISFRVQDSDFLCVIILLDWNASPDAEAFRVSLITSHCQKSQIPFSTLTLRMRRFTNRTHHPSFHSFVIPSPRANIVLSLISSFPALHFAHLSLLFEQRRFILICYRSHQYGSAVSLSGLLSSDW